MYPLILIHYCSVEEVLNSKLQVPSLCKVRNINPELAVLLDEAYEADPDWHAYSGGSAFTAYTSEVLNNECEGEDTYWMPRYCLCGDYSPHKQRLRSTLLKVGFH